MNTTLRTGYASLCVCQQDDGDGEKWATRSTSVFWLDCSVLYFVSYLSIY